MKRQTVSASIEIDAPIDRVWSAIHDPAMIVEAIDWVYEARTEDGQPLGNGSAYIERSKPGIREGTYRWVIRAWEPPRRSIHSHNGGELEADLEFLLETLGDGRTRLTQHMRYRGLPAFRPLGFILERTVMKRKMQRDFEQMIQPNFKRLIEAQYALAARAESAYDGEGDPVPLS